LGKSADYGECLLKKVVRARLGRRRIEAGDRQLPVQSLLRWAMDHAWPPGCNVGVHRRWSHRHVFLDRPPFPRPISPRVLSWPKRFRPADSGPSPLAGPAGQAVTSLLFEPSYRTASSFELAARPAFGRCPELLARLQFPLQGRRMACSIRPAPTWCDGS